MYAATVEGQRLTFVVEAVWRRNMVIRDQQTGTLWQQATGEALIGPLQGRRLEVLGGELMNWAGWKHQHPETAFALEPEKWEALLPKARVTAMLEGATKRFALPGSTPADHRLAFDATVIGVVVQGEAKAYPLDLLRHASALQDLVGNLPLTIQYDPVADRIQVQNGTQPFPYQRTRWIGWYEFHPLTKVYQDRMKG